MTERLICNNNCHVDIYRNWCRSDMQEILFNICVLECVEQFPVLVYNRESLQPRNSRVFADPGISGQKYSNRTIKASPWIPEFEAVRDAVTSAEFRPNFVLINGYVRENDNVGFHRDKGLMDPNQFVVTLSLGSSRRFVYQMYDDHSIKVETVLHSGDLVAMYGDTNKIWEHSIPKPRKNEPKEPRYSLTFRHIANN